MFRFVLLYSWLIVLLLFGTVRSQPMVAPVVELTVSYTQGSASTRIVHVTGMLRGKELTIFVHHPDSVRVLSTRCIGVFAEGFPLSPVRRAGGTAIGCVLPSGKTGKTEIPGPVLQFTLEGGPPTFER